MHINIQAETVEPLPGEVIVLEWYHMESDWSIMVAIGDTDGRPDMYGFARQDRHLRHVLSIIQSLSFHRGEQRIETPEDQRSIGENRVRICTRWNETVWYKKIDGGWRGRASALGCTATLYHMVQRGGVCALSIETR